MFDKLILFLVERSRREFSMGYRAIATVLGATLFLVGWPALVWGCGRIFAGVVLPEWVAKNFSFLFFFIGIPWIAWSVFWQLSRGKGTPVPMVPTKKFLQSGPYRYCRNPMMLGFFFYLTGWALTFDQAGAYIATVLIIAFLVAWSRFVEEKELEQRFGDVYRQYKKETPSFIPTLKK